MGIFDWLKKNKDIHNDNGLNELYYDNGKGTIEEKFNKKNGKIDGVRKSYHRSGRLRNITEYKDGLKDGIFTTFYDWDGEVPTLERKYVKGEMIEEINHHKKKNQLFPTEKINTNPTEDLLKPKKILTSKKDNSDSVVFIKQLGIETTLKEFVKGWEIDLNEFNDKIKENGYYNTDLIIVHKNQENCFDVEIINSMWGEIIDTLNKVYPDNYILIIKDVWYGKVRYQLGTKEFDYTSFQTENKTGKQTNLSFKNKNNNYKKLLIMNDSEIIEFEKLKENGTINYTDLIKYQEIFFIKEQDFEEKKWYDFIKSWGYEINKSDDIHEKKQKVTKNDSDNNELRVHEDQLEDIDDITHHKGTPFTGIMFWEYENGNIEGDCEMEMGLKNGTLKRYTWEGFIEEEQDYKDDEMTGLYKSYHENSNQLLEEGYYINGKHNGVFTSYHENGKIQSKKTWVNGTITDELVKEFDEEGQLSYETTYYKNTHIKTRKGYFKDGSLSYKFERNEEFNDDWTRYYHENGKIRQEMNRKDKVIVLNNIYDDKGNKLSKKEILDIQLKSIKNL